MSILHRARGRQDARASALQSLRTLIAALSRSARTVEVRTGMTNAQLFVLRQLATAAVLSVNEIAARVRTRQNSVSSVVGHLVRAGMATRARSAQDGRRAAVSITARGRRMLARAPEPPTELLIAGLDELTTRDARALAGGLRALVHSLGLAGDSAPLLFEQTARRR